MISGLGECGIAERTLRKIKDRALNLASENLVFAMYSLSEFRKVSLSPLDLFYQIVLSIKCNNVDE